jgi:hypothetical protein
MVSFVGRPELVGGHHPKLPACSLRELLRARRAEPERYNILLPTVLRIAGAKGGPEIRLLRRQYRRDNITSRRSSVLTNHFPNILIAENCGLGLI